MILPFNKLDTFLPTKLIISEYFIFSIQNELFRDLRKFGIKK